MARQEAARVRVLILNRYFYPDISATAQIATDLALGLTERGFEVHALASRLLYGEGRRTLPKSDKVAGVFIHRLWSSSFGRGSKGRVFDYLSFYASSAIWLLRFLRRGDIVIAKTDPPMISVVAAACARMRGAKVVNWLQDLFPEVAVSAGLKIPRSVVHALLAARNWSLNVAEMNVCIGTLMYVKVSKLLKHKPPHAAVIPNWADGREIKPMSRAENELRHSWGLDSKFVVGYSGNFGRVHAFEGVLRAAEALKDTPHILFLLIGDGAQRNALERECSARGLTNVMFKPYQPRALLPESLTVPDVHLVSLDPRYEGLIVPSKLYGAMASGTPIIFLGSGEGEIGELLRNGDPFGACLDPGDFVGIARAIREIAGDGALRQRWADESRRRFCRHFEKRHAIDAWAATLSSI